MNIKPLAIAATLLAALPGAQVGTTMAITGVAITLAAPAEAGKSKMSKNERAAMKLAKANNRAQKKINRIKERLNNIAERLAGKMTNDDGSSPGGIQQGDAGNRPPPYNPNPELGGD